MMIDPSTLRPLMLFAQGDGADPTTKATAAIENSMAELWRLLMNREFETALHQYIIPLLIEHLLPALAILLIGRIVVNFITLAVRRLLGKGGMDETLAKFLGNIVSAILTIVVVLTALQSLGVETTSFAAVLAAAGFAIGMALQGSLSNFAAGVMIIMFSPFRVGDFVEAGGTSGVVEEIQLFHTVMKTGDNLRIIVPNGEITSKNIKNYSANETRRIDLVIGCSYDDNLPAVKQFLEEVVASDERILATPEPLIAVDELADSSVNFVVRPWVKSSDFGSTRWDLIERIKLGFDERGFSLPFPSQEVFVHNVDKEQ